MGQKGHLRPIMAGSPMDESLDWTLIREEARQRDNYTCQRCGVEGIEQGEHNLEVHHITPRAESGSDNLENLITICRVCHDEIHSGTKSDETARFTGDEFLEWVEKYDGPEKEPWDSDGHEVLDFQRTNKLNEEFKGREPHEEGSIAIDADLQGDKELYRVRAEDAPVEGDWLVEKSVLEAADADTDLINNLGLLPEDWKTSYTHVSELDTSQITRKGKLRVSTAGELESKTTGATRTGEATQYQVKGVDSVDLSGWSSDGSLSKYVEMTY